MKTVRTLAFALLACSVAFACSPAPEEAEPEASEETATEDTPPAEDRVEQIPHVGEVDDTAGAAFVDPEQADADELTALPGMTPEAAEALVAGRPYADMTQVDAVLAEHLDEGERETLYEHLWIRLDLNTATAEEIELIPGVGSRMRHEFEEYRPYRAIEEFRREIGKYVDETEVARLERYVELR